MSDTLWIDALKEYSSKQNKKYTIPKKNTPAYKSVLNIYKKLKKEEPIVPSVPKPQAPQKNAGFLDSIIIIIN